MWFYGAIEQLLSGWVFELIPGAEADFDRARKMVVETICGGLEAHGSRPGRRARRRGEMWESLATTRRSDRVLHGAAKLLNVVVGVIALPAWLLGQRLRDPLRRLLARLDAEPAPLPVAQPRERSMDALMADLEAIPHRLRHSEGAMLRKGLADISSFVLAQQREAANLGYAYPAQFSDHVFQGADDEHIAATVGLQEAPGGPG